MVTASVGCSAPTISPAEETAVVRASTSPAETVGVEQADLYRAREVAGVVERRPERTVRSRWTGTFTPARGLRKGSVVTKGARVGAIRTCATTSGTATAATGTDPPATGTDPPATGSDPAATGSDSAATTPACRVEWHVVRAPVAGAITALTGAEVAEGGTLVRIRPPGYVIRATVTDPAALYDLMRPPRTAKTRIVGGPAGFTVRFERRVYNAADGSVVLVLAVPDDVSVVEGLRTSTAFVVSRRTDVPTLPMTAVQGTTGAGQVVVVEGGRTEVTPVELGQHDGARVEVTGLPAGTRVLRFPLASDFLVGP
ncbi:efflux RND transporter periplasmic adaptor subunit [Phycicoccus sp. Soil803]|uniref:efflux RND transporter periplasmic adaptor subunit n=1 Tax=Phycicoccus sp. Soil803 TaxID=1736415 RepID=UPI0012F81D96|nr:efflux RND transporter periplasmic adaptor subunit [Phycicoccus sp. Soil803]